MIVLDVDRFKQVNDAYGHSTGDRVITSVARVLRRRLRTTDTLARLGGDEFAVLLPKADRRRPGSWRADWSRPSARRPTVPAGDRAEAVTVSVGVTVLDEHADLTAEGAMIDADLAMYDAKDAGGDGFAFFAADEHAATRARTPHHLARPHRRRARARPLRARRPAGARRAQRHRDVQYELLLRMTGPHGTLIPPAAFLSIAERDGLIVAIDPVGRARARSSCSPSWSTRGGTGPARGQHIRPLARRRDAAGADRRRAAPRPASSRATCCSRSPRRPPSPTCGSRAPSPSTCRASAASSRSTTSAPASARSTTSSTCRSTSLKLDGELVEHVPAEPRRPPARRVGREGRPRPRPHRDRRAGRRRRTHALLRELGVDLVQGHHFGMPLPLGSAFEPSQPPTLPPALTLPPAVKLLQRAA